MKSILSEVIQYVVSIETAVKGIGRDMGPEDYPSKCEIVGVREIVASASQVPCDQALGRYGTTLTLTVSNAPPLAREKLIAGYAISET